MRIVVVGGGAAGASAASRAKKLNPNAEVILIEKTKMITHGPCGIPYLVEGLVKSKEDLITYSPEEFERDRGIKVRINTQAIDIDSDKKTITLARLGGSSQEKIQWDKIIIATGAIPQILNIPGEELKGVITVRHPAEADILKEEIDKANRVVIIGGGYIGIEMAEAIRTLGKEVIIIEKLDSLLSNAIDKDMSKIVEDELARRGVEVRKKTTLLEIVGKDRVQGVLTDGGEVKADAVIIATGIRPNRSLAEQAGVKLGKTGAIETNEYMETNVEGIYAAGDVAEKFHKVKKDKVWIPLAPSANKEGQVAGANAARGRTIFFPGIVGTSITKFYDLYIGSVGLLAKEAELYGYKPIEKTIKARTSAHYHPQGRTVYVKLIADEPSRKIIGAQILGYSESVAGYIDVASVVIDKGMTIEELYFSDLGYMPATAPVWHPLIVAARVLSGGTL